MKRKSLDGIYKDVEKTRSLTKDKVVIDICWIKAKRAKEIYDPVELNPKLSEEIKIEARMNYVVSLITAAEAYFKYVIMDRDLTFSETGQKDLLQSEKITLYDAYKLFVEGNLKMTEVISHYYPFGNLESIDNVMSKLCECKFLNEVGRFEPLQELKNSSLSDQVKLFLTESLDARIPEWRKQLIEFYDVRNNFVHNINPDQMISANEIYDFAHIMLRFIFSSNFFLDLRKERT